MTLHKMSGESVKQNSTSLVVSIMFRIEQDDMCYHLKLSL